MSVPWLATKWVLAAVGPALPEPASWLIAQAARKTQMTPDEYRALLWHYLPLLAFVLAVILVVYFITRWRKRAAPRLTASDQLSGFRTLYEQGQLSREEFDRLRLQLGDRLRREVELKPAARDGPGPRPLPDASATGPEPPAKDTPPA